MKVISQTELMRLSRGELMVMQRRIAGALIIMRVKAPPARASAMLTLSALPDL